MKFKLIEAFSYNYELDDAYCLVHEYLYDAVEELKNKPLKDYLTWFRNELSIHIRDPKILKIAVTDEYIEAVDRGEIEQPKTMITSQLTDYLESNADLIDTNIDELINNCPDHLKHELTLVLDKISNSLNESVLEEAIRPDLKRFIEQHAELLDEDSIEELYKQCPRELKIPLVRILNAASIGDNIELVKRATYLADNYDDDELIDLALSVTYHVNDVFDAFDYIMNNWSGFFYDDMLNEELLTESINTNLRKFLISLLELYRDDWKTILKVSSVDDIVVHHIKKDRTANSMTDLALMGDHYHRSMHGQYKKDNWDPSVLTDYPHVLVSHLLSYVAKTLIDQNQQDELSTK